MGSTALTTAIRRRLSTFAAGVARPFTDSRRRQFVTQMITGLVAAGHVHLTKVARATQRGDGHIHGAQKRLSGHLASEHWNSAPLADQLLHRSAAMVTEDTLIPADTTDLAKYYARHLEGLGRVRAGLLHFPGVRAGREMATVPACGRTPESVRRGRDR
jgi:hypothetical protein